MSSEVFVIIFAAISGAISSPVVTCLRYWWGIDNIKNEQVIKSLITIINLSFGVILAIIANIIWQAGLSAATIFMVGTGISFPANVLFYRGQKLVQSKTNGNTVPSD